MQSLSSSITKRTLCVVVVRAEENELAQGQLGVLEARVCLGDGVVAQLLQRQQSLALRLRKEKLANICEDECRKKSG